MNANLLLSLTNNIFQLIRESGYSLPGVLAEYQKAQAEGRVMGAADIAPHKAAARAAIDELKG